MNRFMSFATFAAAAYDVTEASTQKTCETTDPSVRRTEPDESSMLQQLISHVAVSAESDGVATENQHFASAGDVLAGARSLVDAVKAEGADVANITLIAGEYARVVESEVIPNIEAAVAEMQSLLAKQRNFVQQCDVRMKAGTKDNVAHWRSFVDHQAAHKHCEATEGVEEREAPARTGAVEVAADGDITATDEADGCEDLRAAADATACAYASHARGVCEAYGDCRTSAMAVYDHATRATGKRELDHRTQLAEAKQASCIARSLASAANILSRIDKAGERANGGDTLAIMLQEVGKCGAGGNFAASAEPATMLDGQEEIVSPMLKCPDVPARPCVDGRVTLDVGGPAAWAAPCDACPAMLLKDVKAPPSRSAGPSWLSMGKAYVEGTFNITATFLEGTVGFGWKNSPTLSLFGTHGKIHSLFGIGPETSSSSLGMKSGSDPDIRGLFGIHGQMHSLFGVHAQKSTANTKDANPTSGTTYVIFLLAVPLAALGIAICVAASMTSQGRGPAGHMARSPFMADRNAPVMSGLKGSPAPLSPRAAPSHFPIFTSRGGNSIGVPAGGRPSMGGSTFGGLSRGQDSSPSLGAPVEAALSGLPSQLPAGLCPELVVPDGNECVLGIPSLAMSAPGEVVLKNIIDKMGQPLLFVGLTSAPGGGEYVLLAKKDQQELAFCELGTPMHNDGWSGKIFRWDGELYARIREERCSEVPGRHSMASSIAGSARPSMGPGSGFRTFSVLSASGSHWELRVSGNFRERKLTIEDGSRQVVAMVSPGEELGFGPAAAAFYKLRLGPHADSCTVIIALLGIERLLGQQGELGANFPHGSGSRTVSRQRD